MLKFDERISIGTIITILVIFVGGVVTMADLQASTKQQAKRADQLEQRVDKIYNLVQELVKESEDRIMYRLGEVQTDIRDIRSAQKSN